MDRAIGFSRDHECDKEDLEELKFKLGQDLIKALRKEIQKKSGSVLGHCQLKNELPTDNYRSFFGPSQPSIARRVIRESTTMPEARFFTTDNNKKSSSGSGAKYDLLGRKLKARMIKEARDYSFLLPDGEPLVPITEKLPTTKVSATGVQSSKVPPSKTKKSVSNLGRKVANSKKEKEHVTVVHQMQHQAHSRELSSPTKRLSLTSENARNNQYVENKKEFPEKKGRMTSNQLQSSSNQTGSSSKLLPVKGQQFKGKKEVSEPKRTESKSNLSQYSIKHHLKDGPKPPLLKPQFLMKRQSAQEKEFREPKNSKVIPPKHKTKRPRQDDSDEDIADISSFIRRIFRYDPLKHVGADGDHDRLEESRFDDILKEERISARLASKEDQIERRRIEQEDRQDRLKREAKKRKIPRH